MHLVDGNLALSAIGGIPWGSIPFAGMEHDDAAQDGGPASAALDEDMHIPLRGQAKIEYGDDIWDFNTVIPDANDSTYFIDFRGLDDDLKTMLKNYALFRLLESRQKISTIKMSIGNFRHIARKIEDREGKRDIATFTREDIETVMEDSNYSAMRRRHLYSMLWQILSYVETHEALPLSLDTGDLLEKSKGLRRVEFATADERKTPNIPEEFFEAILDMGIRVMGDPSASYNERITAALLVILTQTGFRVSDLMGLRTGDLRTVKIRGGDIECGLIHYRSRKPTRAGTPLREFDVFATEICTEAFETAIRLREQNPLEIESDYLYKPKTGKPSERRYARKPTRTSAFTMHYRNLMRDHLMGPCSMQWEGVSTILVRKKGTAAERLRLSIPNMMQYRVHFATFLYNRGVHLEYIRRFMGHLSTTMEGYYARPKDTFQESVEFSERIVREVAGDGVRPLGGMGGDDIREFLQRTASGRDIDVFADARGLLDYLGDTLTIRKKAGGYCCIRTTAIPCAKDATTNEVLCAYGTCPNLHHFYYMADQSYFEFQKTQETFLANLESGRGAAARKELNKAKAICRNRVIPELDELEKTISDVGKEEVLSRYPNLRPVVERADQIRKEAEEWISRKP